MPRLKSLFLVAAIATATALMAQAATTYSLIRKPKVGEEAVYDFKAVLAFGDLKFTISGKNREKIVKVEEDGSYTMESIQSGVTVETPEDKQTMDDEEKSTLVYGPDRLLKSHAADGEESDAETIRLALLTTVKAPEKPVAIGEKWSATLKSDVKETFPVEAKYEVVGTEKVGEWDTIKVSFSSKETGDGKGEASGTIWLNTADFSTVKEDSKIKNAPLSMAPDGVDMTVTSERKK